jgi:F0F1-type ATP synthase assembly protein I
MDEHNELSKTSGNARPGDDPWLAFSYLIAGVGVYGLIGWVLSRWLHADYLTPIGIVVGAVFGLYLVVARFVRTPHDDSVDRAAPLPKGSSLDSSSSSFTSSTDSSHTRPDTSDGTEPTEMPDHDDRGDTA